MLSGTEWQEGMKQGMRDRILMILLQNQNSFISGGEISSKLGEQNSSMEDYRAAEEEGSIFNPDQYGYAGSIPDKLMKPARHSTRKPGQLVNFMMP